nr:MAG TPA: hypothetical protein [Caudoviricetes sp.]
MSWTEPKTNWTENDYFNIEDYNRIKNNIDYLMKEVGYVVKPVDGTDMGEDVTSTLAVWKSDQFNAFESNMDKVVAAMGDEFDKRRYFPNGAFINADSLNRIEQACLDTYTGVKKQETCLTRLDFRLGDVQLGNL